MKKIEYKEPPTETSDATTYNVEYFGNHLKAIASSLTNTSYY